MSITANGQKYTVKITEEPIGGDDGERSFLGMTQESDNFIVIDGTMPVTRQEEVLLHEMMHIADMTAPEFAVNIMSRALYGIMKDNGLIPGNFLSKVLDGKLTKAEVAEINKMSNDMAEDFPFKPTSTQTKVSDGVWDGDIARYTPEQWERATLLHLGAGGNANTLPIREPNGDINRNAAHIAAGRLIGVQGGVEAPSAKKKQSAKALIRIYREDLKEEPPVALKRVAGL